MVDVNNDVISEYNNAKQVVTDARSLFLMPLLSGGLAGTVVDTALYPIDTLKTRLQSQNGFLRSGGFSNLYKGLTPVILGSAPTAGLFFVTYETMKRVLTQRLPSGYEPFIHMGVASFAEMISCIIRVPVEVLKQRKQVNIHDYKRYSFRLLYRGYWSTVLRDMPFSLIQFPIWEYLKKSWALYTQKKNVLPFEGAVCGAIAGSIAGLITTPLDVTKTRIMLSKESTKKVSIPNVLFQIYSTNGIKGLFAGVVPRVTWIFIGGFIFFGVYEKSTDLLKTCIT